MLHNPFSVPLQSTAQQLSMKGLGFRAQSSRNIVLQCRTSIQADILIMVTNAVTNATHSHSANPNLSHFWCLKQQPACSRKFPRSAFENGSCDPDHTPLGVVCQLSSTG